MKDLGRRKSGSVVTNQVISNFSTANHAVAADATMWHCCTMIQCLWKGVTMDDI